MDVHLHNFARDIHRVLRAERLPCRHVLVQTRMKTPRSIAAKAAKSPRPVRDQLGARIVYTPDSDDSDALAYRIAAVIARRYHPHARLTRDYFRHPKPLTSYRSLHLVVRLPHCHADVEVQIRDLHSHHRAETDAYHAAK